MKKVILLILVVLALGVVVATASADPPSFPANVSQLCFDLEENQASYPFDSHGECVAYFGPKMCKMVYAGIPTWQYYGYENVGQCVAAVNAAYPVE